MVNKDFHKNHKLHAQYYFSTTVHNGKSCCDDDDDDDDYYYYCVVNSAEATRSTRLCFSVYLSPGLLKKNLKL